MRRIVVAVTFGLLVWVPGAFVGSRLSGHAVAAHLTGPSPASAEPCGSGNIHCCNGEGNPHCCPKGYKCDTSSTIVSSGSFQVKLAGTGIVLKGTATKSSINAQMYLSPVKVPNTPKHGIAFKIFASRHFPALHLVSSGRLYRYLQATGKWRTVSAAAGNGIYAAVKG